jgi:ankyrin repeat protein
MFGKALQVEMTRKKVKRILLFLILLICFLPAWSEDIHDAVIKGDIILVKNLLEKNPKLVNSRGKLDRTPLHLAAQEGNQELVELLLDKGADIDAQDQYHFTPLHLASYEGRLEVVQTLLTKGANKNARDIGGGTPLCIGAQCNKTEIVRVLINNGVDVNISENYKRTPLYWLANFGQRDLAKLIIEKGADVNASSKIGFTPLHAAAKKGYNGMVELLIKKGAEVNAKDDFLGRTPLHLTCFFGHPKVIDLLTANGADVNIKNKVGESPIHVAAMHGQLEVIQRLLENGAKINETDKDGKSAVQVAISRGYTDITNLFLNKGIEVNKKETHNGGTLLHLATIKGYKELVQLLIARGAHVNARDNNGFAPLYYAGLYGHKKVAELLIENGAKKIDNMEENYGKNPFLKKKIKEKEAFIWYLGGYSWAIKTKNYFIVFVDFWESLIKSTEPSLANGHIVPSEIKEQNVLVLSRYEHPEKAALAVYDWKQTIKNITYIQGFHPRTVPRHVYIGSRALKKIDNIEIIGFPVSQANVGFLLKVDGLSILYSTFHQEGPDQFMKEIDYLEKHFNIKKCDIVFLPSFRYMDGKNIAPMGIKYTMKKLHPNVLFPMSPAEREFLSSDFARQTTQKDSGIKIHCPENKGDRFFYQKGMPPPTH